MDGGALSVQAVGFGVADFEVRAENTFNIQSTTAYAERTGTVGKQGGHLRKLEMLKVNADGFSFGGGLVTEPRARSEKDDIDAWRAGIARAVTKKLKPEYTGCRLLGQDVNSRPSITTSITSSSPRLSKWVEHHGSRCSIGSMCSMNPPLHLSSCVVLEVRHNITCSRMIVTRSAQRAAREAHRNEQALARTHVRLSRRPIFDASGKPHFWDLLAGHPGLRALCGLCRGSATRIKSPSPRLAESHATPRSRGGLEAPRRARGPRRCPDKRVLPMTVAVGVGESGGVGLIPGLLRGPFAEVRLRVFDNGS